MTRIIASLYDRPQYATDVVDQLREAGFDDSQLLCIEPDPNNPDALRRRYGPGGDSERLDWGASLEAMEQFGITDDDADHYADEIAAGQSLIAVHSDDELSGRARQIINRYPLEESHEDSTLDNEPLPATQAPGPDDETGFDESDGPLDAPSPTGNDEMTDASEDGPTRSDVFRASEHDAQASEADAGPHVDDTGYSQNTADATRGSTLGELSSDVARERFKLYRPDFVRHYQARYAPFEDYEFDDYARAYRFGMALAAGTEDRDHQWPDAEPEARRQWNAHVQHPWSHFREAVRFGWYTIRGQREKYGGHRPRR